MSKRKILSKNEQPDTPVLDFIRDQKKRELEFLAQHCHKLSAYTLQRIGLAQAFEDLAGIECGYLLDRDIPF